MGVTVLIDGQPLHKLHDQVRKPIIGTPAIQKMGDAGMIQARQHLALIPEPSQHFCAVQARSDQFDGYGFFVFLIGTRCRVDAPHAAFA